MNFIDVGNDPPGQNIVRMKANDLFVFFNFVLMGFYFDRLDPKYLTCCLLFLSLNR